MNACVVRRTLVHLRDEAGNSLLTLDVLMNGRVRLHSLNGPLSLHAETIEGLWLEAGASDLDGDLYAALLWELDLLALRGDGGWRPG